MANYWATTRSNYFKVKDAEAFKEWLAAWGDLVLMTEEQDGQALYGFYVDSGEGLPSFRLNSETEDYEDYDFMAGLAKHLAEDWVAIVMEAGAVKVRYVTGWAVAINSEGHYRRVRLGQIYGLAAKLGEHVTNCEY